MGAGGFGRELFGAVTSSPRFTERHGIEEIVYLSDTVPPVPCRRPIIGTIAGYNPSAYDLVLLAVGNPDSRRDLVHALKARVPRFGTFVHDRASLGDGVVLGEGVVVCADVRITADVRLGDFVQVNVNCSIGHDVEIGDYTTLSANCDLTGGVKVGSNVFLGTAATIAPGKRIGDGASVGLGSVVVKSVREGNTVFGNPATVVRMKK